MKKLLCTALLIASSSVMAQDHRYEHHDRHDRWENRDRDRYDRHERNDRYDRHPRADRHRWHGNFHNDDRRAWRNGKWVQARYDGRNGWWWVVGNQWYPYARPVYPHPPINVPSNYYRGRVADNIRYYCSSSDTYYPYVATCSVPWKRVVR